MTSRKESLDILGFSGLKQSGGIIDEEFLPKLKGGLGPKTYKEMADNSSTIGAIFFVIESLVRQVEWRVEPAGPEKESLEWAEFLESCLLDMDHSWEDFISEVLSFLVYGWSFFEVVYKLRKGSTNDATTNSQFEDGKFGWRKIALRSQDTLAEWVFDKEGVLEALKQRDPLSGKEADIPIDKAILFRTKVTKDNPEGRSILRNAVIDYYYLKRISSIEAIGIERDMTGLLVMEAPLELLAANPSPEARVLRASFEKMLSELKRDEREFALMPPEMDREGKPTGYKLKLLSTGGNRQINTSEVKNYYKTNILQSVLAQFVQLGMSSVGAFALASSQTDLFATALGSLLSIMVSTFNRFGVAPLMQLNGVKREFWPEMTHGDIETPPLGEIGTYIQALASAGQLPENDAIQRKLLEYAGLPIPESEEGKVELEPANKNKIKKQRGRSHHVHSHPMRGKTMPKEK